MTYTAILRIWGVQEGREMDRVLKLRRSSRKERKVFCLLVSSIRVLDGEHRGRGACHQRSTWVSSELFDLTISPEETSNVNAKGQTWTYVLGSKSVTLGYFLATRSLSFPICVANNGPSLTGLLRGLNELTFVEALELCMAQSALYELVKQNKIKCSHCSRGSEETTVSQSSANLQGLLAPSWAVDGKGDQQRRGPRWEKLSWGGWLETRDLVGTCIRRLLPPLNAFHCACDLEGGREARKRLSNLWEENNFLKNRLKMYIISCI